MMFVYIRPGHYYCEKVYQVLMYLTIWEQLVKWPEFRTSDKMQRKSTGISNV